MLSGSIRIDRSTLYARSAATSTQSRRAPARSVRCRQAKKRRRRGEGDERAVEIQPAAAADAGARQSDHQVAGKGSEQEIQRRRCSSAQLREPVDVERRCGAGSWRRRARARRTTSDAATAITASAKIWPAPLCAWRENAISARLAPFNMISSVSSTISGLRRSSTPSAPIPNRNAESRVPGDARAEHLLRRSAGPLLAGVRAEDDAADRCDEQHDRRDLEGEQVIGQKEAADPARRPECRVDVLGVREAAAGLEADRDHDLDEDRAAASTAANDCQRGPPAHGASWRGPMYAMTKRNITITAPA